MNFYYYITCTSKNEGATIFSQFDQKFFDLNNEKFENFLKKEFFKFLSKNKKDISEIIISIFTQLNDENINIFWAYIEKEFSKLCTFLDQNDSFDLYFDFLTALNKTNQDLKFINLLNNEKLFQKFYDTLWRRQLFMFIISVGRDNEIFDKWMTNLKKEHIDKLVDAIFPKKKIGAVHKGRWTLTIATWYKVKTDEFTEIAIQNLLKNLYKYGYSNTLFERISDFPVLSTGSLPMYYGSQIRRSLINSAKSNDEILRKLFQDMVLATKNSKYLSKVIGIDKKDIKKIINTGYYDEETVKLFNEYFN